MRWNRKRRALLEEFETEVAAQWALAADKVDLTLQTQRSVKRLVLTAACVTGALAVLVGGLYAGNELRTRYKVKRRTPYDYYAHSGDRGELEYSVGI